MAFSEHGQESGITAAPSARATIPRAGLAMTLRQLGPWIGILPFFIFAALFLILPTCKLLVGAFQDPSGAFTLDNLRALGSASIVKSFVLSLKISAASALGGALIGFAIAYAVIRGGLPPGLRGVFTTFSGVASNFAGVPLAFAFIATIGPMGLVTLALRDWAGIDLRAQGFTLFSFLGLTLTYLYFQIPLMLLIIAPAIDGLKREWREAASSLGCSTAQYWWHIALPILLPSLVGSTLLLFANAFGAVATAFALTSGAFDIVPIVLYAQIRGDVLHNPPLGYALAFGMVVITALSNGFYLLLRARAERWLK